MSTYEFISIVLGVLVIILTIVSIRTSRINSSAKEKLKKIKEYGNSTHVIENIYQNIVMLGPRNSGKTSVVNLWTTPWCNILPLAHTESWNVYESSVYEIETEKRYDDLFETYRKFEKVLRIKVFDYGGEDHLRNLAIKEFPSLENVSLLLFFDINGDGSIPFEKNNSYYNKTFLESLESINKLNKIISKVIVVYNKVDLLEFDKKSNPAFIVDFLRKTNCESDKRINSLFSDRLEYISTSALTNLGLISLLGKAASVGLPQAQKEKFEKELLKIAIERKPKD